MLTHGLKMGGAKFFFFGFCLVILFSCSESGQWGKVSVGKDEQGNLEASLENEVIKVRYGYGMGQDAPESCIREVILKKHPDHNLAGSLIDGAAHRGLLTRAEVIKDTPKEKTISLVWEPVPNMKEQFPGPARSEISIFKNSPFLKIRYIDFCFPHICDIGLDKKHVLDKNWGGITRIYGFDKDSIPQYEDCLYWRKYGIFGCDSLHTKNGLEGDPGQLSYKGQMIMGVYSKNDNIGFGRVLPAEIIKCIKILWNKGFEIFPERAEFTGYLYFFDRGEEDALSLGEKIADEIRKK